MSQTLYFELCMYYLTLTKSHKTRMSFLPGLQTVYLNKVSPFMAPSPQKKSHKINLIVTILHIVWLSFKKLIILLKVTQEF